MANILKIKQCDTCQGAGQLMQDSGLMKGYVIPCSDCAGNWKDWSNQYGTDEEDGPEVYVDYESGSVQKIKENKGSYLILPDGRELLINNQQHDRPI